jgi:two-component system, chemotaxis family, protein-glutamate methylesterase/glutaminase
MADRQQFDARTRLIVAIGASGPQGLGDITDLLGEMPATIAAVIMVVLHRPWHHRSYLRAILSDATALPVVIAADGEHLETGTVYIGEPSQHLTLRAHGHCEIINDPGREHGNRTVDLLFKSVALHAGPQMIGVILSGSLDDGSRGMAAIHDAMGTTMVRSPSNPPWDEMPNNAIAFGNPIGLVGGFQAIARGICAMSALPNSWIPLKNSDLGAR